MAETQESTNTQAGVDQSEPYKPIVLSLKSKKKRKKRTSKGLAEVQNIERHLTRASHSMARALEKGTADYRKNSRKSGRKKKDGVLRDFIPNSGLALSRAIKEASPIPYELSRAVNTKKSQRRLKRQLRQVSRSLRRWRM